MNMTQRQALSSGDERRLLLARADYLESLKTAEAYRAVVVEMIDKSSYREVARLTGISTNTLQRWKREAGK